MDRRQKQKLRDAFDSILRADYITLDKIEELDILAEYYIDYFGILWCSPKIGQGVKI